MRLIIKVGSNVLTRDNGKLDVTRVSAIVDQVAWLKKQGHEVILVSSGAVACGRGELKVDHSLDSVEQRQLFSSLGQVKLIGLYYDLFREHGIHIGQVLTMKENFEQGEQYSNQKACMDVMLENDVVPIVNENDTVCVTELMFTDNDELSGLIAMMLQADMLILLSNIDGIYTGNPADPESRLIGKVEAGTDLSQYIQGAKSTMGRGGMASKYATAAKVQNSGIKVIIANGKRDDILVDIISRPEDTPHTEFRAPLPSVGETVTSHNINTHTTGEQESCTHDIFKRVKAAGRRLGLLTEDQRNDILLSVADAIMANGEALLKANAEDLARMDRANPLYDRLMLTEQRLQGIADDMRHVATLPSPLGIETKPKTLDNGLRLRRTSVPFGVIGVIYEARPNVTFDVFSLCIKSGNACILKGGKDADCSCRAAIDLIHKVLEEKGVETAVAELLPATHEATAEMLEAVGYIDVCIPRGGRKLIDFVRNTAKVPVIETGAGVVNTYLDKDADIAMAARIVENGKTRRCSVCNALDCLIAHAGRINDLSAVCSPLAKHGVTIYADERAYNALEGKYPSALLQHATEESFGTEFMAMKMAIRTVDSIDEALEHIQLYGSGHSEAIITNNETTARIFQQSVDAACVYWNAPTSFTDGAQFGLGAEIGISTQKLGPRGPMALEEMTTYKWIIEGEGQIRPQ